MTFGIMRTIILDCCPETCYIEDLHDGEYLADFRTMDEGILFITVEIEEIGGYRRQIKVTNLDPTFNHGCTLLISRKVGD